MTGLAGQRRGQPLVMLATLVLAWIGLRTMIWESPFPPVAEALEPLVTLAASGAPVAEPRQPRAAVPDRRENWHHAFAASAPALALPDPGALQRGAAARASLQPAASGAVMAGHHLLWLAATASLPVPSELATQWRSAAPPRRTALSAAPSSADRWSFDSWLLLRPNSPGEAAAGGRSAGYGASQAGAVVRYRLAPGGRHRPVVYARASQALASDRESELAAGIAARPVPALPLSIYAEMRATRGGAGKIELRPVAFAVTELPPARLPLGLRGEAYVQAGYVGGDFATAFVDGQARLDRELARFDLGAVRAGAGVWGGVQKGARRLDVGPSAAFHLDLGAAPARLAVDYRVRVAGNAAPKTGIAVTLSTGF